MNAKEKGNKFERTIARQLGTWMYGDVNCLWRISDSGARATKYRRKGKVIIPGDIGPYKPIALNFPLAVECKNRAAWSFDQLLKVSNTPPVLMQWWKKLVTEATKAAACPWLIFTKNFHPCYVMMKCEDASRAFEDLEELAYDFVRIYRLDDVIYYVDGPHYLRWLVKRIDYDSTTS
ncbi:MAG: putative PDDEXK endonuclease [Candidatus Thorarchaeota archaeon]|jgi:hypothetical protein